MEAHSGEAAHRSREAKVNVLLKYGVTARNELLEVKSRLGTLPGYSHALRRLRIVAPSKDYKPYNALIKRLYLWMLCDY